MPLTAASVLAMKRNRGSADYITTEKISKSDNCHVIISSDEETSLESSGRGLVYIFSSEF